ncbi:MAG: AAA family ATPase [Phycisphaeraceae bacterium]|nr:AAA family ATPase [Phycisphaeraceae bacterium]
MISLTADRLGDRALRERPEAARDGVEQAVSHCFERSAVVPERRLLAEAMKRSVGDASPDMVADAMATQGLIIAERGGRRLATTREVLDEESRMVAFARNGRGSCRPLAPQHVIQRDWLNDAQKSAVNHVLVSRDRVVVVRGAAGTGKTSMMQEAIGGIETAGTRVFTFAPSADASRGVLRQEGFESADTVSRLLVDERLQAEVRGQLIWIDEAGLLSSRAMAEVFDLAGRLDARVVLSGDRRQHGSVERGAALRLLEDEAGIRPAELRDIQRQRGAYKAAVAALGDGRTDEGFRRLDELGWIREVEDAERYELLARDYLATVEQGKTALVVSPTHLEGEWITDEIRTRLRGAGKLRGRDHHFTNLESVNLTEAERRDALSYSPGDVLVFHQNAKGHRKGDRVTVGDGPLPLEQAARFQLFRTGALELADGDRVRITRNGMTLDGKHRLNNGAIYEVSRFDRDGNIVLKNGWVVSKDYGHLAHGYCTTSHASQGKTVDRVLIGQSAESFPASSREQFYVSVSRGREQATIYTDDREALLAAVDRADERMTATELAAERTRVFTRSQPATPVHAASREDMSHER